MPARHALDIGQRSCHGRMRLFNLHVFDEHLKDELLLPLTTVMVAQTPTPTPETR